MSSLVYLLVSREPAEAESNRRLGIPLGKPHGTKDMGWFRDT